ncbi:MAG TPA: DUF190 domain-containing protein [Frankiaceae bacterium]|nr:DUF190 domain-containing protein [Frankiaceae bacterium]
MRHTGSWQRMTVHVAERHRRDQPLAVTRLLRRAAAQGVAGGTVFAGCAGFGRHHHLHRAGYLHGLDETPLVLVVVDRPDRLRALRQVVDELLPDALVVVDDVDVIHYVRHPTRAPKS